MSVAGTENIVQNRGFLLAEDGSVLLSEDYVPKSGDAEAYFSMNDQDTATEIVDDTGNGYTTTLFNTAYWTYHNLGIYTDNDAGASDTHNIRIDHEILNGETKFTLLLAIKPDHEVVAAGEGWNDGLEIKYDTGEEIRLYHVGSAANKHGGCTIGGTNYTHSEEKRSVDIVIQALTVDKTNDTFKLKEYFHSDGEVWTHGTTSFTDWASTTTVKFTMLRSTNAAIVTAAIWLNSDADINTAGVFESLCAEVMSNVADRTGKIYNQPYGLLPEGDGALTHYIEMGVVPTGTEGTPNAHNLELETEALGGEGTPFPIPQEIAAAAAFIEVELYKAGLELYPEGVQALVTQHDSGVTLHQDGRIEVEATASNLELKLAMLEYEGWVFVHPPKPPDHRSDADTIIMQRRTHEVRPASVRLV